MKRTIISTLVAGLAAVAAVAPAAQAGYGHKHHHHHHHHVHKFHGYGKVHYAPVCVAHKWVYSYGHKKLVCVLWK